MPPLPPKRKKSLYDALAEQSFAADATATPGYRPPPMPTVGPQKPRPRMSLLNALEQSAEGYGDTPQEFVNSALNPIRQGRQARELASAVAAQVRRTGRTRDVGDAAGAVGMGGLLAASLIPGVPGDDAARGVRRAKMLTGAEKSDDAYIYHATNEWGLQGIREDGAMKTFGPSHGTPDQDVWPDGAIERRAYFTPTAANTWQFAPEDGRGVLLRARRDAVNPRRESTGDLYTQKPVRADALEYLGDDGQWHPVSAPSKRLER